MKVVKTEVKPTKTGGHMLVCDLEVQDFGDHVSKKIPYQMNIVNNSAEAQRIGLSQLKTLAIACQVKTLMQSMTLTNLLLELSLKQKLLLSKLEIRTTQRLSGLIRKKVLHQRSNKIAQPSCHGKSRSLKWLQQRKP